ncbi:Alpha/Beta hydrolase protein [Limtongia smithiae]|uniref:Alpha/Beta hydrolase protein n=1 Tax=Limtongia smithiae TaxID=1125753 RepID=UPI0034CE6480
MNAASFLPFLNSLLTPFTFNCPNTPDSMSSSKCLVARTVALGLVAGGAIYGSALAARFRKNKATPPRSNPPTTSYPDYSISEHTFISPSTGRTVSWAEYGSADSKNIVIYEHGLPGSRILPVGPKIKGKDIRVLAMDRPGMGFTSLPLPGKTVMETAISDVYELLDHLEISEKVMLCGFSAGGPHVLGIMFTQPERIRHTYCLGPASYLDEQINWDELSSGSRGSNWWAKNFPLYVYVDSILNASKIVDCGDIVEHMKVFSSKGDAVFLTENPVQAKGWLNVNYEAYRQGIAGYLQSSLEIFGRTSKNPWPVVGDIVSQKGIAGQKVTIIHREGDQLVPVSGSRDLVRRLKAAGADAELIVPAGTEGHFEALNWGMDYILAHET